MGKLDGKIALITGGTTGIGLASARRFHQEGARVYVTGRNPETLAQASRLLPPEVAVLEADSARLGDLDRVIGRIQVEAGRLDILFVNAGIGEFQALEEASEAHWDRIMDVNLKGPFFLAQKALPLLAKGASVVFTTSVVDRKGFPGSGAYTASKAGPGRPGPGPGGGTGAPRHPGQQPGARPHRNPHPAQAGIDAGGPGGVPRGGHRLAGHEAHGDR